MSILDYFKKPAITPIEKPKRTYTKRNKINAAGYDAATPTRNRRNKALVTTWSVDEDTLISAFDKEKLSLEAKDIFRNSLGKACTDRFTNFVVGSGFNIQAKSKDKNWNNKAEKYFLNWNKIADATQRKTWQEILETIVRDRLLTGETFCLLTDNGQLQFLEAERIATPADANTFGITNSITQGIETKNGIPVAYYVCERNDYGSIATTDYQRVLAKNMVHINSTWRWDAIRSSAELAPVLNALRDKYEFTNSTLISAKIAAKMSLKVNTEGNFSKNLSARDAVEEVSEDKKIRRLQISDGEIFFGQPGDTIEQMKQEIPATTYPEFTKSIMQEIAAILGVSYEILMLDFTKADPLALKIASDVFRNWQTWLTQKFIERIWTWRIAYGIKWSELEPAPLDENGISEWYKINVIPPANIFDSQQVQNDLIGVNLGSISISQIARRQSKDASELLSEKIGDIEIAIDLADDLNKRKGTNLTWRDIINTGVNQGSISSAQVISDQQNIQDKKGN